jgi:WD40 repeat protein
MLQMVLSRDGALLTTIGADTAARVWDTGTGKPLTGPFQHRQELTCCAFRGDDLLIATGSDHKTARVWDAQTGEAASPPLSHTAGLIFVGFCTGGRKLVSVSSDAVIRRWPLDDDRSTKDLLRQSRIASGQTVDRSDEPVPVNIQREWAEESRASQSASR